MVEVRPDRAAEEMKDSGILPAAAWPGKPASFQPTISGFVQVQYIPVRCAHQAGNANDAESDSNRQCLRKIAASYSQQYRRQQAPQQAPQQARQHLDDHGIPGQPNGLSMRTINRLCQQRFQPD